MKMDLRETVRSYLWMLFLPFITAVDASLEEVERHLEMGKQFLSKGQFADALTHYHAAVDLDPDNYQTLYRRATVYLAMGRSKTAIPDLDRVIILKPDFAAARLQRGNVLLKQGDLSSAQTDFQSVLDTNSGNADAQAKLAMLGPLEEDIQNAEALFEKGELGAAAEFYTRALDACPWYAELRLKRAECYEVLGDLQKAIADIRATTKLVADSTESYYRISQLYYELGDAEESLNQIRECLKLNPDHKQCFPHYKKVKKLVKQQQAMEELKQKEEWDECIAKAAQILKTEPENPSIRLQTDVSRCRCYAKAGHTKQAVATCSKVLESEPDNIDVICDRAEAYIANDAFEEAEQDYKKAVEINQESRRAQEGLKRAQKLLKQSKKKDYYKILGVRRNADKRTILKAYRKLAQEWHPDNFNDEEKKAHAQAKFIDIAAAKEVLTDPEKREKFDNGEDPLDPEQQQQHAHPFYGFNPFGGGGGFGGGHSHFKFHFQ